MVALNACTLSAAVLVAVSVVLSTAEDTYYAVDNKRNFDREFLHFGKRGDVDYGRVFMPFGKRADLEEVGFDRAFMPFGKRSSITLEQLMAKKNFNRDFMHFGKRVAPSAFDREFLHFGKRR